MHSLCCIILSYLVSYISPRDPGLRLEIPGRIFDTPPLDAPPMGTSKSELLGECGE